MFNENRKLVFWYAVIIVIFVLIIAVMGYPVRAGDAEQQIRYDGNFSGFIIQPCIVNGTPVIINTGSYGEGSSNRTITYQRDNGDIVELVLMQELIGSGFYVRYTDKIASGVCNGD